MDQQVDATAAAKEGFWAALDALVAGATVRIDRPKGATHPRFPAMMYPLDYGYLEGTKAVDGGGVDVWRGSLREARVTGVVCTVDLHKRDTEAKLLVGCTDEEATTVVGFHNTGTQAAVLVSRPGR